MSTRPQSQTSLKALADGISLALKQNDIPRAMHLSWLLMMQPQCPLQLQSHAVLVHSIASLTLGGDTEVIESNVCLIASFSKPYTDNFITSFVQLHAMIKRLGCLRSKSMRGDTPWHIQALGQLRGVWSALHSSQKANVFRPPSETRLRDLDSLVEGFGNMDLGCFHGGSQRY